MDQKATERSAPPLVGLGDPAQLRADRWHARAQRGVSLLAAAAVLALCVTVLIDLHGGVAAFTLAAIAVVATVLVGMAYWLRQRDSEVQRLATVVEASGDAILSNDERGRITSWSPSATRLLGYTRKEAIGQSLLMIVPDEHLEDFMSTVESIRRGEPVYGWETLRQHKNGALIEVEITVTPLRSGKGRVVGAAAIIRDVRERNESARAAAHALAQSEERFRRSFEDSGLGMALVLPDGYTDRLLEANEALAEMTGYTPAQLRELGPLRLIHPDDIPPLRIEFRDLGSGRVPVVKREVRLIRADGDIVWVAMTVSLVHDASGAPVHAVVQIQDMSERKHFEGQLQYLADHDTLTGLFNRRRFEQELAREVATARRYSTGGAVLVLDVDHFKVVNDSLGHAAGDEVITIVGELLRRRLRHSDIVGRMGGDEFAVILPRADEAEARRTGESLLREVRSDARAATVSGVQHVTGSIGIALFGSPRPALTAEELLAEADIAMYDAKEAGRDRLAVFDAEAPRHERMRTNLAWAQQIEAALESDRFVLYAQPILAMDETSELRYELLVRMLGDDGDLIPPATFLQVAERHGLAVRLDQWVVARAVALLADQQRAGHDVSFEVNLSATSVTDPAMLGYIADRISASGVNPGKLIFEITETAAIVNVGQAKAFVQGLRSIGCEFAIDDFGAGFASFYYLKHLDFDYLKIDGEFIKGLATSGTNQLVVRSMADIARGLGQRTIAEFVEEPSTVELLGEYGVDYAQGYFTGRPVPIEDIDFALRGRGARSASKRTRLS